MPEKSNEQPVPPSPLQEIGLSYNERDSDKAKILKTLVALKDPKNFSDMVSAERETVRDMPSKATTTFFMAVKDALLQIIANNILSEGRSKIVLKLINDLRLMLEKRDQVSMIRKTGAEIKQAPIVLKVAFDGALSRAITKYADNPETTQNEIINTAISLLEPEQRMKFLQFVYESRDESRIPSEGLVPTDIRELAEKQVVEINLIIDSAIELLHEDRPLSV